jgi:hypothetical protein
MSLPVFLTPAAEDDVAEANARYGRKRDGLAEEFLLCVEEALERIGRHPKELPRSILVCGACWCDGSLTASSTRWLRT